MRIDSIDREKSDHADHHEDTEDTEVNHESNIQERIVREKGLLYFINTHLNNNLSFGKRLNSIVNIEDSNYSNSSLNTIYCAIVNVGFNNSSLNSGNKNLKKLFIFPIKLCRDKRTMPGFLNQEWFKLFPFILYSRKADGFFVWLVSSSNAIPSTSEIQYIIFVIVSHFNVRNWQRS